MKLLVITPDRDSPPRKDHTYVFAPYGQRLRDAYARRNGRTSAVLEQIAVPVVDGAAVVTARAKQIAFEAAAAATIRAIERHQPARVAIFCHGWSTGLQIGFRSKRQRGRDGENLTALCAALSRAGTGSVSLWACFAGDEPGTKESAPGTGDGSIGDYIRDHTLASVVTHWTKGHAALNRDLIFFEAGLRPMIGGMPVQRGTPLHRNAGARLRADWDACAMDLITARTVSDFQAALSVAKE